MAIIPPTSTLQAIKNKVRRLTRAPSTTQLSEAELENYINTFVVYDFPEHLRMFNLRKTFTFYTNPYQDVYPTNIASFGGITTNPLYNFQNLYLSVHDPVYIAGYKSFFTQSREQFFGVYPKVNSISSIGVMGDGITTTFSGFIRFNQAILPPASTGFQQKTSILQKEVLFSSVDVVNAGLALVDVPLLNGATGDNLSVGNLYVPNSAAYVAALQTGELALDSTNFINYATGEFTITFPTAPGANQPINSQTVPQQLSLPQGLIYYDNTFIVRPVPDQPYRVNFEVYARPTYLLDNDDNVTGTPALEEWWQYIAYGAAKKVFEDRMDMDSVQLIMPEFKQQERMCLRRTIVQNTNQRVATEYTEQTGFGSRGGWGWGGGSF